MVIQPDAGRHRLRIPAGLKTAAYEEVEVAIAVDIRERDGTEAGQTGGPGNRVRLLGAERIGLNGALAFRSGFVVGERRQEELMALSIRPIDHGALTGRAERGVPHEPEGRALGVGVDGEFAAAPGPDDQVFPTVTVDIGPAKARPQ